MFDEYYDDVNELEESMKEDEQKRYSQSQNIGILKMLGIKTRADLNKLNKVVKILLEVMK